MKLIKKIQKATLGKGKKTKKKKEKKIDRKILKTLKKRYIQAKKERKEAKAAYLLALNFFEGKQPKKKKKQKNKLKVIKVKKPKNNASEVLSISDLSSTAKKVKAAKKTTKPKKATLNVKKSKILTPLKEEKLSPSTNTQKRLDDLKIVEGIGPAIEEILKNAEIKDLENLSKTTISKLRDILHAAGPRFRLHQPDTWPKQAEMATAGKWIELEILQEELHGGKKK